MVSNPSLVRPALRRRTEQRLVAGVAGGLADWLNAPVGFVRVVLLLLAGYSSIPAAVYAGAALLIPARGHDRPSWDNLIGAGRVGLLFLVPAVTFGGSLDLPALFDEAPSIWIPLVALQLIGLAVLLSADYVRGRARTDAEARAVVLAAAPLVCFALVLAGAVVLFPGPRWERLVPAAVLLAGAALLVATLNRSGRAFVAPAVVTVVLGASVVAAGTRLEGGVGDASLTTTDAADGSIVVRRAVGDVTVDLRRLDTGQPVTVVASVGMGELRLGVPNGARLVLDAHVGNGRIDAGLVNRNFHHSDGLDSRVRAVWPVSRRDAPGAPRIRVVADVGVGEISVDGGRNFMAWAEAP
jgi:phage shock protein PspC (stress-responsive transcriptional regulator)